MRYIMILNGVAKYIEINKHDSSEKYGEVQKKFAKEVGMKKNWLDVEMIRLHDNQFIGNVYYLENFYSNGARFRLIKTPKISDEEIKNAINFLKKDRDVLSIFIVKIKKVIV